MSIVPYHSRGREIVLRHHNAVVVRDPSSRRLELDRALTECPTCHQPLRSSSPERAYDASSDGDPYVNPDYFRMLRDRHDFFPGPPPSSPIRRLVQSFDEEDESLPDDVQDAEFVSSSPAPQAGSRIRRDAFQPNYFRSFFVEERELGRGGKGVVLLVRHEIDGCHLGYFACKRVPVGDDHAWLEKVLVEVELLAKLSHPNLVSYRHVWLEDVKLNRFGPSVACAFILQQYCNGGDLLHKVVGKFPEQTTKEQLKAQMRRRSKGQLEKPNNAWTAQSQLQLEDIYSYFRDITSGLAYLHAANYIHRDLKPSNCLLHEERGSITCLISDFGEVQPENVARKSTGSTGTISYCAPEVLRKDITGRYGNFTTKSDVFSLGMILYFMCFGRLPYHSANTIHEELEDVDVLRAEIADWKGFEDERRERPELPGKLYTLLKQLLALNPGDRPSANEVLAALKNVTNLEDPRKRATVQSVSQEDLNHTRQDDTLLNSLQKLPTTPTPGHRAPTMSPSRSPDSHRRAISPMHRHSSPAPDQQDGSITTPLLMPPPTSFLGGLRISAYVKYGQFRRSLDDSTSPFFRFVLFVLKMAVLARACWPVSFNMAVGGGLVVAAAVDLSWALDLKRTIILFLVHVVLVFIFQSRGELCLVGPEPWDWDPAFHLHGGSQS
ncbi:putative serine/threonine-protein kinase iksA [Cytospora mali]|uniref:non-specific serine/threonine protein kinase n=1 Tax=Cytospora mali TaxID=578113 RepID=A0A194USM1_CYTMA|nr:putative serine/threonine-protein kinase iksA [Valsa mali var. pyri (nom. inval.)]